ncbi:hypothetical protein C2869_21215 [Saccharobesus litoralis]|uniref:OmpR/PhoB-type domain-containing protein n=1 Tax=Saccharobesus litoralis TaxID=2172099 RepID=A0A2S0VX23_9ALTE|nr:hypothetical protein [Saccharobesus litoralis]AWB68761.1 hypothetical protein C2869_21215 [Saccharobesus litoralis]
MRYQINHLIYDPQRQQIVDGDQQISLRTTASDVLLFLITSQLHQQQDYVQTYDIGQAVWGRHVSEQSIYQQINYLRGILGADILVNEPRKGYTIKANIVELAEDAEPQIPSKRLSLAHIGIAISLVIFVGYFIASLFTTNELDVVLSEPTPVSSMKGQALHSAANDRYLVYTHRKHGDIGFSLYLQDLNDMSKVQLLGQSTDTTSYYFPYIVDNNVYYIKTETDGRCQIFANELPSLDLAVAKFITDCGPGVMVGGFAVTKDHKTLYFTKRENTSQPFNIYAKALTTGSERRITLLNNGNVGDYDLALSNDGAHLAYFRYVSGQTQIRLQKTKTQESQVLHTLDGYSNGLTWLDGNLIFESNGDLLLFDMDNEQIHELPLQRDLYADLINPYVFNGQLYYTSGQFQVHDAVSTKDKGATYQDRIATLANDQTYRCSSSSCFFVSDRFGINQIFEDVSKDVSRQVSYLTANYKIDDILLSEDNQVFVLASNTLYQLNFDTGLLTPLLTDNIVTGATDVCHQQIFVTLEEYDINNLYRLDLTNSAMQLVTENVRDPIADCYAKTADVYYLRNNSDDLFSFDLESKTEKTEISNFNVRGHLQYDVFKNKILRLQGFNQVTEFSNGVTASHDVKITVFSIRYDKDLKWVLGYSYSGDMKLNRVNIRRY